MTRPAAALTAGLALALAACGSQPPDDPAETPSPDPTPTPTPAPTPFTASLPAPDESDPMAVVDYWQQAVEAGDGSAARLAWRDSVRIGGMQPRWRVLKSIRADVGEPGEAEVGGHKVVTVLVRLTGTNADGAEEVLSGVLRLRRVPPLTNEGTEAPDVAPGAAPPPWRIDSIDWDG